MKLVCKSIKALSVIIVRSKICSGFFFQKGAISSVEMTVFKIKDKKPVRNYIPLFVFYINSFCIYSTILSSPAKISGERLQDHWSSGFALEWLLSYFCNSEVMTPFPLNLVLDSHN